MNFSYSIILLLLISVYGSECSSGLNTYHPTVITRLGRLQGVRKSISGYSYEEFLGIKYGKIPKRFEYSEINNEPWEGMFNATSYGPMCTQAPIEGTSEDCLFINIWRPVIEQLEKATPLPVLFWVHGSAFQHGSSAQNPGDIIAASGPIIVATINYRLGAFGFAFGDNDTIKGNQGISDVITALLWTRDNIGYFGGDPKKVTLAGQSAGSMIGSIFPVLPTIDHSLYSRLWLMSGVSVNPMFIEDTNVAIAKTKLLATKVGCGPVAEGPLTHRVIECLRTVDASIILDKNQDPDIKVLGGDELVGFLPVYGTPLIPKPLMDLFWSNLTNDRVTMMISIAKDEASSFWNYLKPKTRAEGWSMAFNKFSYVKKDLTESEMKPFYDFHFNGTVDGDERSLRTALTNFMNDYSWRCSSLALSEVYSSQHSVYFGEFDYIIDKYGSEERPDGPWHGDSPEIFFGNPLRPADPTTKLSGNATYSDRDAETSKRLIQSLISFVSGENPNSWPEIHFDRLKPEIKPKVRLIDYKDVDVEYNRQSICVQWSKLLNFDVIKD